MRRVWAREWGRFVATPRLWWFLLILPLALPALLLLVFVERVPEGLPMAVVDADHSAASRQLVQALNAAPGLSVRLQLADPGEAGRALQRGEVYAVIIIPADFARDLMRAEQPRLQLFYNRQTLTAGNLVLREVRTAVATLGIGLGLAQGVLPAVLVDTHALFNPGLDFGRFLALPLAVALLHLLMVIVAIDVTGRELKDGSAGDWLAAAGSAPTALAAKLMPHALWFALYGLLILALMLRLLGLEVQGSVGVLMLGWVGLVLASFGLGVFLVGLLGNLRLATSIASVLISPAFAYSGMTFPTAAMSGFAAFWSQALPLGHFLHLQAGQVALAAPPATARLHLLALLLFALAPLLSLARWRVLLADPSTWGRA